MLLGVKATRGKRHKIMGKYIWVYTKWHLPIKFVFNEMGDT